MAAAAAPAILESAREISIFGSKAVQLGALRRARLPVPEGVALPWSLVDAVAAGDASAAAAVADATRPLGAVAVRSSAIGEDGAEASFAGVHETLLNVSGAAAVIDAVRRVHASAGTDSARAYRERAGLPGAPRMGVLVQRFLAADVSGILFTRHPVTGADERVIEASWGLGEAVVGGLVTPDHVRVSRTGAIRELRVGDKDVAIVASASGGTEEQAISPSRASIPSVGDETLRSLLELASRAEELELVDGALDLEWCLHGGRVHLLQLRPQTA